MNEEERALLNETAQLSRDNNKILKSMQRTHRVMQVVGVLKWGIILFSIIASYALIQPYLEKLQAVYMGVQGAQQSVTDLKGKFQVSPEEFDNFLKSFNVGS